LQIPKKNLLKLEVLWKMFIPVEPFGERDNRLLIYKCQAEIKLSVSVRSLSATQETFAFLFENFREKFSRTNKFRHYSLSVVIVLCVSLGGFMSKVTSEYVPAAKVRNLYAISRSTLRTWAEDSKVEALRANGNGRRLYKLTDIEDILGVDHGNDNEKEEAKLCACYARVSSQHQRADLDRQIAFLQQHYPGHTIYHDIGSGLNFKRPQFVALLDAVYAGTVREIVVTDKDRLCRFGAELVQWLLGKAGTKLLVHSDTVERPGTSDEPDYNHELSDDILSIITFFTARHNGQRSARNRKRRRADDAANEEAASGRKKQKREAVRNTDEEDSSVSDS
jgi:putative resolvase